jgi:hypothetical protein
MCLLFFLSLVLIAAALVIVRRWRKEAMFRPLTSPKARDLNGSAVFGMRAAAPDVNQDSSRLGGRRRPGALCFVTGVSRTECTCGDCRRRGR